MKKSWKILAIMLALTVLFTGCKKPEAKKYDRQLAPGELALRKITDPAELPNLTPAFYNKYELEKAVSRSLEYMSRPSSQKYYPYGEITHSKVVMSLERFRELLSTRATPAQLNEQALREFDVYVSVGCDDEGTVLFTGYYTPIFDGSRQMGDGPVMSGSRTRTDVYRYPLYKMPQDLVKGEEGEILGRRMADGTTAQYPDRAEIERSGMLAGTEVIWLADKFDAYVAHVQGSAKVRLADGELITLGYAGNNGHEYRSVNTALVEDGKIPASEINLSRMIEFFKQNPNLLDEYVNRNPRFVFFREQKTEPLGSLNVEVTKMRTVATDKSVYPRASLVFLDTKLPRMRGTEVVKQPFSGFLLDQDTGGAIRAPGRCDIYMGVGDKAGELAGYTCEEGKLYYLFLK